MRISFAAGLKHGRKTGFTNLDCNGQVNIMRFYDDWFTDWRELNLMIRCNWLMDGRMISPFSALKENPFAWEKADPKAIDVLDETNPNKGIYGYPFMDRNGVDVNFGKTFKSLMILGRPSKWYDTELMLLDYDDRTACRNPEGKPETLYPFSCECFEIRAYRCNVVFRSSAEVFMQSYYEPMREYYRQKVEQYENFE